MAFSRFIAAGMCSTVLATLFGSQALADSITIQSTPRVIEQRSVIVPAPTVIEERQVVAPIVEERQVVVPQAPIVEEHVVVPGDTVTRRTTLIESTGPKSSVSSESVVKETNPLPAFHRRLQLMKEQVSEGLSKGLVSTASASSLQSRIDSLMTEADRVLANGTPKDLNDQLETRLNTLNIDIADSMKHSEQLGSGSQMQ